MRRLLAELLETRAMLATVYWGGGAGTSEWNDDANWIGGMKPQTGDDVVIDVAGDISVTHSSGTTTINSLSSNEALTISGGTLDVATTIQVSNTFNLAGGTIQNATVLAGVGGEVVNVTADSTLDGVTLDANLLLSSYTGSAHSYLRIENGLTLNGVLTMRRSYSPSYYYSTILEVAGNQSITGGGTIQFAQQGSRNNSTVSNYVYSKNAGETLTIGVTVQGQDGYLGRSDAALINTGTIDANTAGSTITVRGSSVTNNGTLQASGGVLDVNNLVNNGTGHLGNASASGGGTLDLDGTYTIGAGQSLAVTGGSLRLRGDWSNAGSIDASNAGTVHLHDQFTVADLGTFNRIGTGNRANIVGTLDNSGAPLTLDAATDWTLEGGRINGGTVNGDGTLRVIADSTLDGVTLDANLLLSSYTGSAHSYLRIENGLTLNGVLTMRRSYGPSYYYSTILEVADNGVNPDISGSGTIQFAQVGSRASTTVSNYVYSKNAGETLTIDGITIQGQYGYVGRTDTATVLQGTIDANTAGNTIVVRGSSVTNNGTLKASGGTLDVDSLVNNASGHIGTASASGGGTLDLDGTYTIGAGQSLPVTTGGALRLRGDWNNAGSIDATAGTVHLHDQFTVADLGTFNRIGTGNRANIVGTLDNSGAPLTLDATTDWTLEGGRINGGTVNGDGTLRVIADSTLDGVTLDANLLLASYTGNTHSYLRIENGLTLNGVLTMRRSYGPSYYYSTILEVAGNESIAGSGTIQFAQVGSRASSGVSNYVQSQSAGETLTIDVTVQGQAGYVGRNDATLINTGTIDADTAGNTIVVRGSSVTNSGTFRAAGGLLNVESPPTNLSAGTLTGGTWEASGSGDIRWPSGNAIDTIAATVLLDGAGANIESGAGIDAIAAATNITAAGALTIENGHNFTAPGSFTNEGSLIVGSGSTFTVPPGGTFVSRLSTIVDGTLVSDSIVVESGVLGGSGNVSGTVTVQSGGAVAPGSSPGILSTGNIAFSAGSIFSFEFQSPFTTPGADYDQLNVTGSVNLGGANLAIPGVLVVPPVDTVMMLINNDEGDAVIGTFNGLPQGGEITVGDFTALISYSGGDGNDVVLVVTGGNELPDAIDDNAFANEDGPAIVINLTANDTDPDAGDDLEIESVNTAGLLGSLVVNADNDTVTYDPNGKFESLAVGETALETFKYTVTDGNDATDIATVTVTVNGQNDAPTAVDDAAATGQDQPVTVSVLVNDSDTDGDTLTVINVSDPPHGAAAVSADKLKVVYTPDPGFDATDTLTYTVSDGNGGTATATVTVLVNDAPVAADDQYVTEKNSVLSITTGGVLSNDQDINASDTLTVSQVNGAAAAVGATITLPSGAKLTLLGNGNFTYNPNGQFDGLSFQQEAVDTFEYTSTDGRGGADTATVEVRVTNSLFELPDLRLTSADISFSPVNPAPGDPVTISAVIRNSGFTDAEAFDVEFLDFGVSLGTVSVPGLGAGQSTTVALNTSYSSAGYRLIDVVADAGGVIEETREDNNEAGGVLQIGTPATPSATINVTANSITTYAGQVVSVTGSGFYDFDTVPGSQDYPVQGGAVTVEILNAAQTVISVFAGSHTTVGGAISQQILTPLTIGTYTLRVSVTDFTATGFDLATLNVVEPQPTDPPPPPPPYIAPEPSDPPPPQPVPSGAIQISSGSGGGYVGGATSVPGGSTSVFNNVYVYSENIFFSDTNPDLGEEILVFAYINFTGTNDPVGAFNVELNDIFPVAGALETFNMGSTTVNFPAGQSDSPQVVVIPYRNTFSGAHIMQIDTSPPAEKNATQVDDDATRLLQIGPASTTVEFQKSAALLVDADGNGRVSPGDTLQYSIVAANNTAAAITGAAVVDDYDETQASTPTAISAGGSASDGAINWTLGTIGAGSSITLTYQLVVSPAIDDDAILANVAFLSGDGLASLPAVSRVPVHVNDAPEASNDTTTTDEDSVKVIAVLANDEDVDGDPLSVSISNSPAHGSVHVNGDGSVTYTPDADFHGSDSFQYAVDDNYGGTDTATVNITINPVADAFNDDVSTDEDVPLNVAVLANDRFSGAAEVTSVSQGAHGSVVMETNGTVTYTPSADYHGEDSFTYTAISAGFSETATVTVTIAPVADVVDDTAGTDEDTPVSLNVLTNDNFEAPAALIAVTQGAHGSVVFDAGGTVIYTPNPDFHGTDSFTYTAMSADLSETAMVSVTVAPVADVVDDTTATNEDTAVSLNVLNNDSFEATATLIAVTPGAHGSVVFDAGGVVTYTPNPDFNGPDSFTYTAASGETTETATVTVNVAAVADAVDDVASTLEDAAVSLNVLANDNFEASAVVMAVTQGTHGSVTFTPAGGVTYTPNPDFNGSDSFTYTAVSGGVAETATVNVTVTPVTDALDDVATADEDSSVSLNVLANDNFEASVVVTAVTDGAHGSVTFTPTGGVTYTPNADYNGSDSFTYTAVAGGVAETATVQVTVNSKPDVDFTGRVFDDRDNNSVFDGSDAGVSGITVQLFDEADLATPLVTTTTNAAGVYAFDLKLGAGTYRIVAAQPEDLLDGKESAGNFGGVFNNLADSNVISSIVVPASAGDILVDGYDFANIRGSRVQGLVWEDANGDGAVDANENAIPGVTIRLQGADDRGAAVDQVMQTDENGIFEFVGLRPSNSAGYTLTETQPAEYLDGLDVVGTVNGVVSGVNAVDDVFTAIGMTQPGSDAVNYNFAEILPDGGAVQSGQTATIGFWQNKNGQELIRSLNGGAGSVLLGNWLAATFPNMYGHLAGKSNDYIAQYYTSLFKRNKHTSTESGPPKVYAQTLALVLAVYVTDENLAGTVAMSYGFTVDGIGLRAATFNVGDNGAAFGVENDTDMTVFAMLRYADDHSADGILYDLNGDGEIDAAETVYCTMANDVFTAINEAGDI